MSQQVKKEQKQILNQKKIKTGSLPRKQDRKISKNNKKFVEDFTAGGFEILK